MNSVCNLSPEGFEVVRKLVDAEARRRKTAGTQVGPGQYVVGAQHLVLPAGVLERNPYPTTPTVNLSPLGLSAFVGHGAGATGPALQAIIVRGLVAAVEGGLGFNDSMGIDQKEILAVKKELWATVPKVQRIRSIFRPS